MRLRTANNHARNYARRLPLRQLYPGFVHGAVFESCSLHPCRIVEVNVNADHLVGVSLLTGTRQGCSLRHCGVYVMSEAEVQRRVDAWEKDGERGLLIIYTGSEEAADQFIKVWG